MMSQESGSSGERLSFEANQDLEPSEDEQMTLALEEYARLKRAGRLPPRGEFLARHPTIAAGLGECLDGLELVEDAASHFARRAATGVSGADLSAPAQLGEFRLLREIGRNGMGGAVFEAEQGSGGRRVALKVLPAGASPDSRRRHRFQAEAQAAGFLRHEHIVPIFGTGFDAGVHYSVMQFIDGRPLSDVMRELKTTRAAEAHDSARIDLPELALPVVGSAWRVSAAARSSSRVRQHCNRAVRWAVQAADALEHAHQLGVVHRGIKPSNLLIDGRGRLWVTDFGLARLPRDRNELVRTDRHVATLRYLSPEQLVGSRCCTDARTDIYALGVTLYELLTLHPAHDGPSSDELRGRILQHEPASLRRLNKSIARDLETVVMKAIAKDPSARYASARELAADLRRFLADQPVRARRPSLRDRSVRLSSRHRPAVMGAACAVVLSLVASTAFLFYENRRWAADLDELRHLEMQERAALDNAVSAIDQITLAAVESRLNATEIRQYTSSPRAVLHPVAFSQAPSRAHGEVDELLAPVAQALRRAGRSRLIRDDARGRDDFRRAIRIYEQLVARFPKRYTLRLALIDTLREFAALLVEPIDSAESRRSTTRALELAELRSAAE